MPDETQFDLNQLQEVKRAPERPAKLYRAFTINPETLTIEKLKETLRPGKHAADDPTRIGDGNELGVYMSTSQYMVEKVYASGGGVKDCFIPTQHYVDDSGGQVFGVDLPVCGLVMQIDTAGLPIREPRMIPALQGHYNNGFEGYEWIADEVPPDNYKLIKLVLSRRPNDSERIVIDVSDMKQEELQEAIQRILLEYGKAKRGAEIFKMFLKGLEPKQRMNGFYLKRAWEKYKAEHQNITKR